MLSCRKNQRNNSKKTSGLNDRQTLFIGPFWPRLGVQEGNESIERHCCTEQEKKSMQLSLPYFINPEIQLSYKITHAYALR